MKLLAISGGPDSMFLLNQYRNRKIVVAHVNYHKREDSNVDENIVRDFCEKHKIPIFVLNVKKKPTGNFQNWARDIRYEFFRKIYKENNCNELLMAHHKDDFLETALMQQESNRNPKHFGMYKKNNLYGMKIKRPFLNLYWKSEILKDLEERKIGYAIDSSNEQPIFSRNKIRISLNKKTDKEKQDLFRWFVMSNKILKKKNKIINNLFLKWEKSEFDCLFINKNKYADSLIYELVHRNFQDIKLSQSKIDGIKQFIKGKDGGKKFMLNNTMYLTKKNNKLTW